MKGVGRTFERDGVWYFAYSHRGVEYKRSSHSRSEAIAKRMLNAAIRQLGKPGYDPDHERLTFEAMYERAVLHPKIKARRSHDEAQRMAHLRPFFQGMRVPEITTEMIDRYITARQAEGAKSATINRELAWLRRMFTTCEVARRPTFNLLPEANARRDFLDFADFAQVRENLPAEFRDFFSFLYFSSWRQGQVAALEWRDVDLSRGEVMARGETTKGGRPHLIPLTGELREIIDRARTSRRLDCPLVFHREGEPFRLRGSTAPIRKAWKAACAAAGFAGHVPHCLRRSGIRNMVRAGVDPTVAMEISGHRTASVFQRYNIVTVDDQRTALDRTMTHLNQNHGESKVRAIR